MASLASETEGVELVEPGPLEESATIVNESPLSTAYTVEEKSTIPSDGISHQVLVASLPFEAEMTYVAVPRVETIAYLQVALSFTRTWRLANCLILLVQGQEYERLPAPSWDGQRLLG